MEQVTLKKLALLLSEKANLPLDEAESFVTDFFNVAVQNLTESQKAEIENIGSFRVENNDIIFTPDEKLKARLNEPFEIFSPIVLEEGVDISLLADTTDVIPEEKEAKTEVRTSDTTQEAAHKPVSSVAMSQINVEMENTDKTDITDNADSTETTERETDSSEISNVQKADTQQVVPPVFDEVRFRELIPVAPEEASASVQNSESSEDIVPLENDEAFEDEYRAETKRTYGITTVVLWAIISLLIGLILGIVLGYFSHDAINKRLNIERQSIELLTTQENK